MDVPTCRVCGFAILEVIDHGRDLYDGLCGGCAYQKFVLQHDLAPGAEPCEWCSELETTGPLVAYDDGRGEGRSWVCQRCYRGALAHEN